MSGNICDVPKPSEDYLQFMQMLEEGKHLEPFSDETFPPCLTKGKILEISNKFPISIK